MGVYIHHLSIIDSHVHLFCQYHSNTSTNAVQLCFEISLTYWRFSSHFSSLSDRLDLQQQATATREWCRNCLQILILEPNVMLGQTTYQVHPQSTAASRDDKRRGFILCPHQDLAAFCFPGERPNTTKPFSLDL